MAFDAGSIGCTTVVGAVATPSDLLTRAYSDGDQPGLMMDSCSPRTDSPYRSQSITEFWRAGT